MNSFEQPYVHEPITKLNSKRLMILPLLVELDGGKKLCITEADLEDYPGMFLNNSTDKPVLKPIFASYPKVKKQGGHNNLQMLVEEREDYIAKTSGTRAFPWRMFIVSENDKQLADCYMVYRLASPCRLQDVSWVKPGKVAWDWWNDWNIYDVDFRAGINTETYKYYIDFAAEHGIEYVILDEGWSVNMAADLMQVIPEIDIPELVKRARACGAVILMDAAQSAPHMPIDVQKLDVDFVAFSGHKMLAPMGIGVLYGKQELLEKMPPFLTGGEMIETVSRYDAVYAELPHKFEAGTVNAGGAVGLAAAIDYLESYGMDTLHAVEQELTAYLFRGMNAIPHVHVLGSQREDNHTGIVSFTVDQVHPHDISEVLSSDGMDIRAGHHCAQPLHDHLGIHSTARASLMFYNTKEEIDRFLESVSNIRRRMGFGNE